MICQKSGQPVELCEECKAMQAAANAKRGVDQVTPPRNDVRGEIIPGNVEKCRAEGCTAPAVDKGYCSAACMGG